MTQYRPLEMLSLTKCPNCGADGKYLTWQHWPGTPNMIHCSKCGCSTKQTSNEAKKMEPSK
jgi:Zn ribbon nucleic-acid-binding protein